MLIAIASTDNHVKSYVDPHFGRCNWYCLYDTENGKSEFVENNSRLHQEKAGSDAAHLLAKTGVKLVVAGRFGSKAVEVFRNKDIQMVIPEGQQTINEIINLIK